jgi:glycine C-acetyltransferase
MGARMMSGNTADHVAFEGELAAFSQKEAAILFNYGYLGVLGTINSLTNADDIIILDKLAHACIVDGAKLSQAQLRVFRHNDMDSLEAVLKRVNRERKGGVLIVTEGTYGMTGDLAKLPEICDLKEKYDARLFIDDAHGVGVLGEHGRGTADHLGVQDRIDVFFGTFAKSFAAIGGFSAADREVVDWITYNARTQVFAKSLPMVYVKAMQKTLELIIDGDDLRERLWRNSNALKAKLADLGYFIGAGESPICSVFVPLGDRDARTIGGSLVKYLRERGVFVSAVIYPVIPLGLCMFRMIPTASHTQTDVDETVEVFRQMRDEMKLSLVVGEGDLKKISRVYGVRQAVDAAG